MENSQIFRITAGAEDRLRPRRPRLDLPTQKWMAVLTWFAIFCATQALMAQQSGKQQWKTLPFAIVRYNDDAPKSWNVYRGERKGIYLVRLWKRYLLVDTDSQDVFEIDPEKVKVQGENAELAAQDIPADPLETSEWRTKNAGPVLRHRFRFGKTGNFMELQIPVLPNGRPAY
jgi:hypothetical protein